MNALLFYRNQQQLALIRREIPKIVNTRDVLVKVRYAGVCGTDLHILHNEFPCKEDGLILGHEFAGVVVDKGCDVTSLDIGDQVAVDPNHGCYVCRHCHIGNPHFCKQIFNNTLGIFQDGGWSEYALIPEVQIRRLPSNVTLEQGMLAEPISCITHALDRWPKLVIGERILIIGCGIIGHLFCIILNRMGHQNVTACEINEKRLSTLRQTFKNYDFLSSFDEIGEKRYDVIIDCSGNAKAIETAFTRLDKGGKLLIFSVVAPQSTITIAPFDLFDRELCIMGTKVNPFAFPTSFDMIQSIENRFLDYQFLGIKTYKLCEYKAALDDLQDGRITKAVFQFTE